MGELREIPNCGPEAAALDFLKEKAEQITTGELQPDGVLMIWFTQEGLVDYDYTESMGVEQVVALGAIVQAMATQEYIDYDD